MFNLAHILVPLGIASLLVCSDARSQIHDSSRVVRPGVFHLQRVDETGPWRINVVEVDLDRPNLEIQGARALYLFSGRELTTSMAARKGDSITHVVAAINADFFSLKTGESMNYQIIDGTVVKAFAVQSPPRSQFGMTTSKRPVINRYSFVGSVLWSDGTRTAVSGINHFRRRNAATLFNAYAGKSSPVDSTRLGPRDRVLARCGNRGDTLLYVVRGGVYVGGGAPVTDSTIVLSLIGEPENRRSLSAGDTVGILITFQPDPPSLRTLIGGTPHIVRAGMNVARMPEFLEGTAADFSDQRHPRSGVGFSRDSTKLFLITVDGRQQSSVGMTLSEFANLMISVGVWEGLNLDGGGSTAMVIEGSIVNVPSDAAGERPVGNCLLVVEYGVEWK